MVLKIEAMAQSRTFPAWHRQGDAEDDLQKTTLGTWANAVPAKSTEDIAATSTAKRIRFFMFVSSPFAAPDLTLGVALALR